MKDHYEVLGVARSTPPEVIKAAWRALAQKYHPDRNKEPHATGVLKSINVAYEVLSDPDKRAAYDRELGIEREGSCASRHESESGRQQSAWSDAWEQGNVQYVLYYRRGVVREHREWQQLEQDRKTMELTRRQKQEIWFRFGDLDEFLRRDGTFIPVAASQEITLVSLELSGKARPIPIVLINDATRQWYELTDFFHTINRLLPKNLSSAEKRRRWQARLKALVISGALTLVLRLWVPWILALLGGGLVVMIYRFIRGAARAGVAEQSVRTHLASAGIS